MAAHIQPAGVANSLNAKLQSAIAAANAGNLSAACSQLNAFINQVHALINNGSLTAAQGQPLIDAANDIAVTIPC